MIGIHTVHGFVRNVQLSVRAGSLRAKDILCWRNSVLFDTFLVNARLSLEIVAIAGSANGIMWSLWPGIVVIRLCKGNGIKAVFFFQWNRSL